MNNRPIFDQPREYPEVVDLFNDMLFDRLEFDSSKRTNRNNAHGLTREGERALLESGMVNRIFRAWYQYNWLHNDFSEHFSGATFRQEIEVTVPGVNSGEAKLSIQLEEHIVSPLTDSNRGMQKRLTAVPHLFSAQELRERGGAFCYGLDELAVSGGSLVAPNYDPDFVSFARHLQALFLSTRSLESYALHDLSDELQYWRLFIEQAAMAITRALDPSASFKIVDQRREHISTLLCGFAGVQKDGETTYLDVDDLCRSIWEIHRQSDGSLYPFEEVMAASDGKTPRKKQSEALRRSMAMSYQLGFLVDKYFLFPADHYFNALEVVWQDKLLFLQNLRLFHDLCNGGMRSQAPADMDPEEKKEFERFGMQETMYDPGGMWINPPTSYRFYDWALEIV